MSARIDPERQRVLAATKPAQRGLPLSAIRAREFAQMVDGEILLVSVVFDSVVAGGLEGAAALETVAKSRLIEDQRLELERTAQSLRDWGAAVTVRVVWDAATDRGILRVADEWHPTLVVVGAHEPRAMLQTPLTDTHWRLVHACTWPLLLAKPSASNDRRTILAAVDPSRAESRAVAHDVLRAACRFATALDCQVRVVHAFPDPENFALVSSVEVSPGVFYGIENIAELHRRAVEELAGSHGIDPSHTDVRPGEPAAVIRQLMMDDHDVRLVVLGLSRHSLLQQVVLGSITQAVTSESPCDVLLIPQPSRTGDDDGAAQ
jgi:nucleotide-binding universal stress UspA family protein